MSTSPPLPPHVKPADGTGHLAAVDLSSTIQTQPHSMSLMPLTATSSTSAFMLPNATTDFSSTTSVGEHPFVVAGGGTLPPTSTPPGTTASVTPQLVATPAQHSVPTSLAAAAATEGATYAGNDDYAVVDPKSRKIYVPRSSVLPTNALTRDHVVPSLCLLFHRGKCFQGQNCHQAHVPLDVVERIRAEAASFALCCKMHGDVNSHHMRHEWESWQVAFIGVGNEAIFTVTTSYLAYTKGLQRQVMDRAASSFAPGGASSRFASGGHQANMDGANSNNNATPTIQVSASVLCRLHIDGRCRQSDDCKFVHVCVHVAGLHRDKILAAADRPPHRTAPFPHHPQQPQPTRTMTGAPTPAVVPQQTVRASMPGGAPTPSNGSYLLPDATTTTTMTMMPPAGGPTTTVYQPAGPFTMMHPQPAPYFAAGGAGQPAFVHMAPPHHHQLTTAAAPPQDGHVFMFSSPAPAHPGAGGEEPSLAQYPSLFAQPPHPGQGQFMLPTHHSQPGATYYLPAPAAQHPPHATVLYGAPHHQHHHHLHQPPPAPLPPLQYQQGGYVHAPGPQVAAAAPTTVYYMLPPGPSGHHQTPVADGSGLQTYVHQVVYQ